jgi:hypothetical protein
MGGFRSKSKADLRKQVPHFRDLAAAENPTEEAAVRAGQTKPLAVQTPAGAEPGRFAVQGVIVLDCPYAGKRRYKSKANALSVAKNRQADENGPNRLRAYKCPYCDGWHLSKSRGRK